MDLVADIVGRRCVVTGRPGLAAVRYASANMKWGNLGEQELSEVDVVKNNKSSLTADQFTVYRLILDSSESGNGKVFFLDALCGKEKTFLSNLL